MGATWAMNSALVSPGFPPAGINIHDGAADFHDRKHFVEIFSAFVQLREVTTRRQLISCGAALYYARLALRARGLLPVVTVLSGGPGYADLDMDLAGKEPLAAIRAGTTRPAPRSGRSSRPCGPGPPIASRRVPPRCWPRSPRRSRGRPRPRAAGWPRCPASGTRPRPTGLPPTGRETPRTARPHERISRDADGYTVTDRHRPCGRGPIRS